jgi:tetratricopeptide (TPR) repeat protein
MEQRVMLTPNSATAHRALGQTSLELGHDDTGYAELVMALLLDTGDTETLTSLGHLHLASERYDRAVEALGKAVALDPYHARALQALGDALIRRGSIADGRARIEQSERARARNVEEQRQQRRAGMLAGQAEYEVRERRYERAIELWRQLIELEGGTASSYLQLAEALAGAARLDQAVTALQAAISMKAGPEAHRRLADVYSALGRAEDSARERQVYVERRLQELREPAEQPAARK